MISDIQKAQLVKSRIAPLLLTDDAVSAVAADNKRPVKAVRKLFQEWLYDVALFEQSEYRAAANDPMAHFTRWITERFRHPYRVSDATIKKVRRRYNNDFASKFYLIVWPQEIAWAQNFRMHRKPIMATKAGYFLALAETDPKQVFERMADLYSDAAMTATYRTSAFRDMSPEEIRHSENEPEYKPLFMQYVDTHAFAKMASLTSEQVTLAASQARRAEEFERQQTMTEKAVSHAERFPMRQDLTVINIAMSQGVDCNDLFLMEHLFIDKVKARELQIEPGSLTPHSTFIGILTDKQAAKRLRNESRVYYGTKFKVPDLWDFLNFQRQWVEKLPHAFSYINQLIPKLGGWQTDLMDEKRPMPYDPVSDFGYYLMALDRKAK